MKRSGQKAHVFFDSFEPSKVVSGGASVKTAAGEWYFVLEKGINSNLPYAGTVLKAPAAGEEQIELVAGDRVFRIDKERFCKTSASVSVEEGTIDVGDDCDPGATIPDGIVNVTGSLGKFFRYDSETGDFDSVTAEMLNRFFSIVDDDGKGVYKVDERVNATAYLLICLNSDAKPGQIENWLFVPAIISSLAINLGNTDAQNQDISWSKGEGEAIIYRVPKGA